MKNKLVRNGLTALVLAVSLVLGDRTLVRADRVEGVQLQRPNRVRPPRPQPVRPSRPQPPTKAVPIPVLVPGMIAFGIGLARKRKLQNSN